jgi:DNA-directed RNA polymerase subunit M/transcription elongation factor TFIIS
MNIKHCEHCNLVFSPANEGAASILCRKCVAESESEYIKIRRYVIDHQDASLDTIAAETEVPRIFIDALVLDGRFGQKHSAYAPPVEESEPLSVEEEQRRQRVMKDLIAETQKQDEAPASRRGDQGPEKNYGIRRR